MKRTQIQLPEPLYKEVQRVAKMHAWSITEGLRRGAEHIVRVYPADKVPADRWRMPEPADLGPFLAQPDDWRELANNRDV